MIQNDLAKISLSFVMLTTACEFFVCFFLICGWEFSCRMRVLKTLHSYCFSKVGGGGPVMSLPRKEKRIEDSSWKYRRQLSILQIKSSVSGGKNRDSESNHNVSFFFPSPFRHSMRGGQRDHTDKMHGVGFELLREHEKAITRKNCGYSWDLVI